MGLPTIPQRRAIMEKANEKEFYLNVDGKKYPAKIAGYKLDFPFVAANGSGISDNVSWRLAERISKGEITVIDF